MIRVWNSTKCGVLNWGSYRHVTGQFPHLRFPSQATNEKYCVPWQRDFHTLWHRLLETPFQILIHTVSRGSRFLQVTSFFLQQWNHSSNSNHLCVSCWAVILWVFFCRNLLLSWWLVRRGCSAHLKVFWLTKCCCFWILWEFEIICSCKLGKDLSAVFTFVVVWLLWAT